MDKIGFKGVLVCNVTTSDPEVNDEWASENEPGSSKLSKMKELGRMNGSEWT